MDDHVVILLRVVLAFGLALAGGAISVVVGVSHQRLCGLISLAAGTLLGVTVFAIIPECAGSMNWWGLAVSLASGYGVFFLISKYVYHVCPACAASHFDEATTHRFSEIAGALVIALGIHSTMDGIALVAGHEGHQHTDFAMLLAIGIHKVPEGLALGALLLGAGYKRGRAMVWVALVESTTILGGLLGVAVLPYVSPFWLSAVLAHAGGGFLFLAAHAVLGELVKHAKAVVLANFAAGIVLIALAHWAAHAGGH